MSPEPLPLIAPLRPCPKVARRGSRLMWCGSSGASVPSTMMLDPGSTPPRTSGAQSFKARPTGTPSILSCSRSALQFDCTNAPTVYVTSLRTSLREAVPEPPLKP